MPWQQLAPGRYSRPVDTTDTFFRTVSRIGYEHGREHFVVNAVAKVDLGTTDEATVTARLRKAWTVARYRHPLIAAEVADDDASIGYVVPSAAELERWLDATLYVEHESTTVHAYRARAPLKQYAALHWFPKTSELLLRAHHSLVDGIGTIHLLSNVLQYYAGDTPAPTFGDEWKHLPPGLSEMVGFPVPSEAEESKAQARFQDWASYLPPIGLPCSVPVDGKPEDACSVLRSSTVAGGAALVAACKARGFSVTSAVHAAIVVALREMKVDAPPAENFLHVLVFNYRKYLPAPYNNVAKWPEGNRVVCDTIGLPAGDFETYARKFHQSYHQPLARDQWGMFDAYDPFFRLVLGAFAAAPPPDAVPSINPQLTSLGLLEDKMPHAFEGVHPVRLGMVELGVDVMNPSCVLHQWSWQGRFHLNANFNSAYLETAFVETFVDRTFKVLFKEMGVDDK
jgi:hypothetical protein